MEILKVYLNNKDEKGNITGKKVVEVELVERRKTKIKVKLPDGNIIERKLRDIVKDEPQPKETNEIQEQSKEVSQEATSI